MIEEERAGNFVPLTQALPGPDGHFEVTVLPTTTTRYRAVVDGAPSPPVTLLVLDRQVNAAATRAGGRAVVRATVTPPTHGATLVLQLRLRERFGWWPVRARRTDHQSTVRFAIRRRRPVRARVVLTLRDRATVLATSETLRLPAARRRSRTSRDPAQRPRLDSSQRPAD
jgi:hypothetical protein